MKCSICRVDSLDNKVVAKRNGWLVIKCKNCRSYFSVKCDEDAITEASEFYAERELLVGQYLSWAHRDFLKIKPAGEKLLDIGCGTGDFIVRALDQGYDAWGIDMDSRAVEVGNKHWGFNRLVTKDAIEYLNQDDKQWDIITLFGVIEHLFDPHILFGEIIKHLKPGGYVAIAVQNMDSFYSYLWTVLTRGNDYPPHHYSRWSRHGLEIFVHSYGFEITDRTTSKASVVDINADIIRQVFRNHSKTLLNLMKANDLFMLMMTPLEKLISLTGEGRGQMVIAQKPMERLL
ncbi:MAG: class I SAM-dependent methyltransferase [Thermoplasmata archaeon]|nr:class I SAM-dependent methyltransferase [Thermoplasmata archaeon]